MAYFRRLLPRAGGMIDSLSEPPQLSWAETQPRACDGENLTHAAMGLVRLRALPNNQEATCILQQHFVPFTTSAGLVLAWTHAIAAGDGDIAVIVAEPENRAPASVCDAEGGARGGVEAAAEATKAGEWSRFFSPMAHLCVFSSQHVSAPILGGSELYRKHSTTAFFPYHAPFSNEGSEACRLDMSRSAYSRWGLPQYELELPCV